MLLFSVLNNKDTINSDYLGGSIYNLLDKTFILHTRGFDFNIFDVSEQYIARPDLVSKDAYGDSMYADVICKINGISNPFELNEGMKLILPRPEYILDFAIKPPSEEAEQDDINIPIPKQRNIKRSPNEAIIGDSRFKIDSTSGVIIY